MANREMAADFYFCLNAKIKRLMKAISLKAQPGAVIPAVVSNIVTAVKANTMGIGVAGAAVAFVASICDFTALAGAAAMTALLAVYAAEKGGEA